jgi:hypothetical protein
MGLRMDIHNPSVPAASTAQSDSNGVVTRELLLELMGKKADLEKELEALGGVLESVNRVLCCRWL